MMRPIRRADKKAEERAAFLRAVITDRSLQNGIFRFQSIKDGTLRDRTVDLQTNFRANAG